MTNCGSVGEQAAALAQLHDNFGNTCLLQCTERIASVAATGERGRLFAADEEQVYFAGYMQDFFGDFLTWLHAGVKRDEFAESSRGGQNLARCARWARVHEAVAHEADSLGPAHGSALTWLWLNEAVGAATAEEGALSAGSDVDVEKASHGLVRALDVAEFDSMCGKVGENHFAERVVADTGNQKWEDVPLAETEGAVGAYAAAVQLEAVGETLFTLAGPGAGNGQQVYVEVAEDQDPVFGGFFSRHGRSMVPPSATAYRHFRWSFALGCHRGCWRMYSR